MLLKIEDFVPRNQWPMGRIIDVFPDNVGTVRTVKLKTADGSVLVRPITKLILLLESE